MTCPGCGNEIDTDREIMLKEANHAQGRTLARLRNDSKAVGRYVWILKEDWEKAFNELRGSQVPMP